MSHLLFQQIDLESESECCGEKSEQDQKRREAESHSCHDRRSSIIASKSASSAGRGNPVLCSAALSHTALFVLLAAAAGAGVVAADFRFQVADWFEFSIGFGAGD